MSINRASTDDILIEMITPKVKEIEESFSKGEGLSQDDVNTLLLKSQYNYISHLNMKLNEATDSIINLESKFDQKFPALESKFDLYTEKMQYTIQQSLNKNTWTLFAALGLFLILSKLIDKFV